MAELEILEALVGFFCPTSDAASACREFISNPNHQVLSPIGPLFYFLLFPLIFTILFVYVISDTVLFGGKLKWAKVLIGISAFIFIIISGWYPVMLVLSEFWYIVIIVFGGVYWFLKGHKKESGGGGGGGGSGKMSALSLGGAMAALGDRAEKTATGEIGRMQDLMKITLTEMKNIVKSICKNNKDTRAWDAYHETTHKFDLQLEAYKQQMMILGRPIGSKYNEYVQKREKLVEELGNRKDPRES